MTPDDLQQPAKLFSLRVIKLVGALPSDLVAREIGRQLVRSGMSVSANYRAARRGRSKKEFTAKTGIVVEEADETVHWLELLIESGLVAQDRLEPLHTEAEELVRIFASTQRTARAKARRKREKTGAPKIAKSPNHQITRLAQEG